MVSTWTPCGFYGDHMFPHGHNMVAMWILCGSMCTPCSFHMDTMWFLSEQNVITTLTPHGIQVDTT